MTTSEHPETRRSEVVRSFKARQGRISSLTSGTFDRLGPRYLLDPEIPFVPGRDLATELPVVLEIGCGFGEATVAMATLEPQQAIVAVDVHTRGIARLMQQLERRRIENVKIVHSDAVPYLRDQVAPSSLAGARIFFPDPWPKARHGKRRLVQPHFLDLLAARLERGAIVHCATDWAPYAHQMLGALTASHSFVNTVEGFAPRPTWRPLTRFESAGLDKGHAVYDVVFERR